MMNLQHSCVLFTETEMTFTNMRVMSLIMKVVFGMRGNAWFSTIAQLTHVEHGNLINTSLAARLHVYANGTEQTLINIFPFNCSGEGNCLMSGFTGSVCSMSTIKQLMEKNNMTQLLQLNHTDKILDMILEKVA